MTDLLLEAWVSGCIELEKFSWMLGGGRSWQAGEKLKLLLSGYGGARNTGADIRVHEILRQLRRIFGAENLELSVMTQDFALTKGYFGDARQVYLPDVYPPFLMREVPRNDGVIACEGSMFKSKFANALTTMNIGSLALAAAGNKLSVGYGGEAGAMDPLVQKLCRRYCRDSFIITRNPESRTVLGSLGISSELGTDTAWTFEPLGSDYAAQTLKRAGWDGRAPVLAVCPIHPFYWPVKASILKSAARTMTGAYKYYHYRGPYFHRSGRDVEVAFDKYISALGAGIDGYRKAHPMFAVVIGMEQLDRDACARLAKKLGGAPIFTSDKFTMFELVSILRACSRIVSSRYHAIVTSMPTGVISAGVTMDERIGNLMRERGHEHLLLRVDDPELAEKLVAVLERMDQEPEAIRDAIGRTVVKNLQLLARMGTYLEAHVAKRYPEFLIRSGSLKLAGVST